MKVTPTAIPCVKLIEPRCFGDPRGFFFESFNARRYAEQAGIEQPFVQDNHSFSEKGVLRGLHYQLRHPQGKLIRVASGSVYDVAVDLRAGSKTFRHWVGVELSAQSREQLWIPPGFAHGFIVLSSSADVLYKATDYYDPDDEFCLRWDDEAIGVEWPVGDLTPRVSNRDRLGKTLGELPLFD